MLTTTRCLRILSHNQSGLFRESYPVLVIDKCSLSQNYSAVLIWDHKCSLIISNPKEQDLITDYEFMHGFEHNIISRNFFHQIQERNIYESGTLTSSSIIHQVYKPSYKPGINKHINYMFFSNGMFTGFLIYIRLTVISFTGNSVWKYLSGQVCLMLSYGLKPYCEEDCIEAANFQEL